MRIFAGLAVWSALLVYAGPALACIVRPLYTFDSISPSDGAREFPRNGAIQIRFDQDDDGKTSGYALLGVRVVRVDTGEVATGKLVNERVDALANTWLPNMPFEPNAEYRIEVSATESGSTDTQVISTSVFRTSSESAGELRLDGRLSVSTRLQTTPRCIGVHSCGGCVSNGERLALYAELELPEVSGGFDAYGYVGALTLNGDAVFVTKAPERPESRVTVQSVSMQPNTANTIRWELRRADRPYSACFGLSVSDPIGHGAEAEVVCISEDEIQAAFAEFDAASAQPSMQPNAADEAKAAEDPRDDSDAADADEEDAVDASSTEPEKHVGASCAAMPGMRRSGPFGSGIAAFVLLGVLGYRKRARRGTYRHV